MKKNFLLLVCLILALSCTAPSQFYVRNMLTIPVKFILLNESGVHGNRNVPYQENLKTPEFGDNKSMNKRLSYTENGDSIIFLIPPKSTVYLGLGEAGQIIKLRGIMYFTPDKHIYILKNNNDYDNIFIHKSSFGHHAFWLDIK